MSELLGHKPGSVWLVPNNNQEILKRAIKKAFYNGYEQSIQWMDSVVNDYKDDYDYSGLIFDHEFAKALWPGDENTYAAECYKSPVEGDAGFDEYYTTWEYHLREMVISPDPIKYLGENI